jgi:hypothetical protein
VISKSQFLRASAIACLFLVITAWSSPRPVPVPGPEAALQAIPVPDPRQYEHVRDMKTWRNPYLIVRADDVALFDSAANAEIMLKPDELVPALARLPASNWPYGRVVAAATDRINASEQRAIAVRRNKGIVGGLLLGAHVAIKWVPSA